MTADAHLQLVVDACRPAVEAPLNALVINTALHPLPEDGSGARFIAADGERLFEVALDGSSTCLLDVATLAAYLRMHGRVDWMLAATPSTFDASREGVAEALGLETGPSLLLTLRFREGGSYSGLALTGQVEAGGWQVLMPSLEQDEGSLSSTLLGRPECSSEEAALASRLSPRLREAAKAFLASSVLRQRLS
jgi:hypothetical protein